MSVKLIIEINGEKREFDIPIETVNDLASIAARYNLSLVGALEQAVGNAVFLDEQQASGAKVLIGEGTKLRELVRERQPA